MADLWPGTLPQILEESGYSEAPRSNVISSQPDAGPDIARRRSTAAPVDITGSMLLTAAQYATLRAFYESHQALRFQWVDPRGATRYYRFKQPPKYSSWSIYFRVQLSLVEFLTEFGGG
ncbi:MAG: hypothetical protein Q8N51_00920 [Gammaproteobacteria bacterium]|nr:hypothetical protein [Gammaproteobacteria bacterium]